MTVVKETSPAIGLGIFDGNALDATAEQVRQYLSGFEPFAVADVLVNDDSPIFWRNAGPLAVKLHFARGLPVFLARLYLEPSATGRLRHSFIGPQHSDCPRCPPLVTFSIHLPQELSDAFYRETRSKVGQWCASAAEIFRLPHEQPDDTVFVFDLASLERSVTGMLLAVILRPEAEY